MIEYPELIKSKYIFVFENKISKKPKKIDYGRKLWKYKTHYRKTWDHHNFRFGKTKKKKILSIIFFGQKYFYHLLKNSWF